jgi:hypothetical protein
METEPSVPHESIQGCAADRTEKKGRHRSVGTIERPHLGSVWRTHGRQQSVNPSYESLCAVETGLLKLCLVLMAFDTPMGCQPVHTSAMHFIP